MPQFKSGDKVIRISVGKTLHRDMKVGDVDVVELHNGRVLDLKKFGLGHDPEMFRLYDEAPSWDDKAPKDMTNDEFLEFVAYCINGGDVEYLLHGKWSKRTTSKDYFSRLGAVKFRVLEDPNAERKAQLREEIELSKKDLEVLERELADLEGK